MRENIIFISKRNNWHIRRKVFLPKPYCRAGWQKKINALFPLAAKAAPSVFCLLAFLHCSFSDLYFLLRLFVCLQVITISCSSHSEEGTSNCDKRKYNYCLRNLVWNIPGLTLALRAWEFTVSASVPVQCLTMSYHSCLGGIRSSKTPAKCSCWMHNWVLKRAH